MCRGMLQIVLPVTLSAEPKPLGMGAGGFLEEVAVWCVLKRGTECA